MKRLTAILLILLLAGCGYRIHFFTVRQDIEIILNQPVDPFDWERIILEIEKDREKNGQNNMGP